MSTSEQFRSWRARFALIWVAQAFSLVGSTLAQFALIWWLTATTGSATVLATGTLVALLPEVLLGPLIGTLVDRWNRRTVMIVADSLVAAFAAGLVYLFAAGAVQVWHVYVVMLARSLGGMFHWPAMQASVTMLVPKEELSRVAGFNQALRGAINIVAPPVAALLLAALSVHGVLLVDVGTAALAVGALLIVHIPQPVRRADGDGARPSVWADLAAGMRYVLAWPGLRAVILMATLINLLFRPAMELLPIMIVKHFGGGAIELAWIDSAAGLGIVAGGLLLGAWGGFRRRALTSMLGLAGLGAGCLAMALAPASMLGIALAAAGTLGLMLPLVDGPLFAVLQASVAPEMQGRVFTLVGSLAAAMAPIGLAIAGPLADAFGVQIWFLLAGIICLAMSGIGATVPAIANLGEERSGHEPRDATTPAEAPALTAE